MWICDPSPILHSFPSMFISISLFAKWNEMEPGQLHFSHHYQVLVQFVILWIYLIFFCNFNQELIISCSINKKNIIQSNMKSQLSPSTPNFLYEKLSWENVSSVVPLYLASRLLWALESCWSRKMPWSVWDAVTKWHNLGGHKQQKSAAYCSRTQGVQD